MAEHNELGKSGESQAALFLYKKGYTILERDYDHPAGQIDIIAQDGPTYVFVEVKTRESGGYGSPEAQLTRKQQLRIVRSALLWLKRKGGHPPARFDLIAIDYGEIRHHRNAFTLEGTTY
jgi:putative endonuclease